MTPLVLIHGGGLDGRCWDRLLPLLDGPALAVDLPGRGRNSAPLESATLQSAADGIVAEIDEAGFEDVVLAGHSLAGCSMPFVAERLGARVRHLVFIACTVPKGGESAYDTLEPEIQALIEAAGPASVSGVMDGEIAKLVLGNDLDDEQFAWCVERLVPEAFQFTSEPVSLAGVQGKRCTWVRTRQDLIISPEKQLRFVAHLPDCNVVDIDAGHMCMVGKPEELAQLLNEVAGA